MQIYGIDLASEKFDVSYTGTNGNNVHKVIKNDRKSIQKFLDSLPEDAWIVAEHTGTYGDMLLYLACASGVRISYVSGYEIKHSAGLVKGKSDPADAAMIRDYGERHSDTLVLTEFPSAAMYSLKQLYATRRLLVKQRKELMASQHADKKAPLPNTMITEVKECMIGELESALAKIEAEMESAIDSDPELKKNSIIVKSIPGIGKVTLAELIIKTGNFKRISTAKKCASLAGIAPFPNSTGKTNKGNHVSHMGDKQLKSLLFMCALSTVMYSDKMRVYKMKKNEVEHKHYFLVMNNVANKLLKILYALIKKGEIFNPIYMPRDPRLKYAN